MVTVTEPLKIKFPFVEFVRVARLKTPELPIFLGLMIFVRFTV